MSRTTYEKQTWHDLPEEDTPISAERLSHIEDGIADAANNRALKEVYNDISMALGPNSTAATYSVSHGYETIASGAQSHAEGFYSTSPGRGAHAEGNSCNASGGYSHAEGKYTIAYSESQHVEGKYNIPDIAGDYALIIGNGEAEYARSNALTVDWEGNLVCRNIPAPPAGDGNYVLSCTVSGGVATYEWITA